MPETYLLRMNGGPFPGDRLADAGVMPWPPPEVLDDPEGRGVYRKESQSELPPQDPDSGVLRGAAYQWEAFGD